MRLRAVPARIANLAHARASAGAVAVVGVIARADDGRGADATGVFPRPTARADAGWRYRPAPSMAMKLTVPPDALCGSVASLTHVKQRRIVRQFGLAGDPAG